MNTYAIIRDGIVENVILWDGVSEWSPPEGTTLVQTDEAGVGDSYDGKAFTRPIPPPQPKDDLTRLLDALAIDQSVSKATADVAKELIEGKSVGR